MCTQLLGLVSCFIQYILRQARRYALTGPNAAQDALYGDGLNPTTLAGLSIGGVVAGTLWSAAYWFCTPLQLLLLFLGRIDVERPSDWLSFKIGQLARLP